ncbi:hypothetical protein [Aureliella helgolandensis]|uniref:Uncharacterized protein n=1 Tax=Aureliella helgolandensis TaxID=2527968 RepID=A0A518GA13_9BACT|nr:hypothetical protein [Aureliella helgolandensis]QDV25437.1 hypothetical protein Q31a_37630 [Aureliella helgolandensis]
MKTLPTLALLGSLLLCTGCAESKVAFTASDAGDDAASAYLVSQEPKDAMSVGQARKEVEDANEVTLVGRIGGSYKPFVDGIAAFTIVDSSVPHCAPEEGCPTPWDYCCTMNQVKDNIATVKVVDESGAPVTQDARELLQVKELSTVVVHGTAQRDDQGNLSVLAREVFVRPAS